jgi:hypothetical protein
VYWPTVVPAPLVRQEVTVPGRGSVTVEPVLPPDPPVVAKVAAVLPPAAAPWPAGAAQGRVPADRAPLGRVAGARSGDKGGNANLGVWARTDQAYQWLAGFLTVEMLRKLLPETGPLPVQRYELPNLRAVNFVIAGLLGEGAAASTRLDPQAKSLGEWLRARVVDIPRELIR